MTSPSTQVYPVIWNEDRVLLIDQNRLPTEYTFVEISCCEDMARAIKTMIVRGAPAIGVAAAYGMYLGAREIQTHDRDAFLTPKCCGKLVQRRLIYFGRFRGC
jgi:methylthioribose-1-phosphate isomerase